MIEATGYERGTIITRCKRLNLRFKDVKYFQQNKDSLTKGKYLDRFAEGF